MEVVVGMVVVVWLVLIVLLFLGLGGWGYIEFLCDSLWEELVIILLFFGDVVVMF